ncbi:hypothetical protein ACVIHI_008347 [Bradyrhizobium sp. USDA 4524]|nr:MULTISPECIES: hypothetical protein [Bradyrhizobium]MCP1838728.1 hypothetical protein [Bradyrhizobium sp. USDA 4538]MCP1899294.1 hypothetical protein [Bradyrhizobium sp. USDA 4537]MCP1986594.1 hypothetical protein [Bradyrhizobium sp. USDA 4539]
MALGHAFFVSDQIGLSHQLRRTQLMQPATVRRLKMRQPQKK